MAWLSVQSPKTRSITSIMDSTFLSYGPWCKSDLSVNHAPIWCMYINGISQGLYVRTNTNKTCVTLRLDNARTIQNSMRYITNMIYHIFSKSTISKPKYGTRTHFQPPPLPKRKKKKKTKYIEFPRAVKFLTCSRHILTWWKKGPKFHTWRRHIQHDGKKKLIGHKIGFLEKETYYTIIFICHILGVGQPML